MLWAGLFLCRALGLEDVVPGSTAGPRPALCAEPDAPQVTECRRGQNRRRGRLGASSQVSDILAGKQHWRAGQTTSWETEGAGERL